MDTKQIKAASTQYHVTDLIKNRFSPRAFSDKAITLDDVNTVLEAASWAPSAMNEQPWRYHVALKSNQTGFQKLVDLLVPGNTPWAKNASALVLCTTKLTYSQNQQPNGSTFHDTGMANQNLLLQALSMDIYAHVMGGFDKEKSKQVFNISNDYQPICIIALGYLGNAETLTTGFKERELAARTRKPLAEVVTYL
jgi:nitroreductase